jgi:hypothetical protein
MTQGHNSQKVDPRLDAYDPPCPEESFRSTAAREALIHAWDLLKLIIARFWNPVELGALRGLAQWRVYDFLDWLKPVELMLRRMLLVEARALAPSLPAPKPARPHKPQPSRYPAFEPQRSETWPVRFLLLQPARPTPPRGPRSKPKDDPFKAMFGPPIARRDRADLRDTWALARRLEAAVRVVCDPMPWIRRLARSIRRKGACDPSSFPTPQPIRVPRTLPTLDALARDLGLPPTPRRDSS